MFFDSTTHWGTVFMLNKVVHLSLALYSIFLIHSVFCSKGISLNIFLWKSRSPNTKTSNVLRASSGTCSNLQRYPVSVILHFLWPQISWTESKNARTHSKARGWEEDRLKTKHGLIADPYLHDARFCSVIYLYVAVICECFVFRYRPWAR